jgi:hypothetical protein
MKKAKNTLSEVPKKQIKDFINGKVTYDTCGGTYLWVHEPKGGCQMLGEIRGWGHIQNMFRDKKDKIDVDAAAKFQDELGNWVAEAINEKMEKENISQNLASSINFCELSEHKLEQLIGFLGYSEIIKKSNCMMTFADGKCIEKRWEFYLKLIVTPETITAVDQTSMVIMTVEKFIKMKSIFI